MKCPQAMIQVLREANLCEEIQQTLIHNQNMEGTVFLLLKQLHSSQCAGLQPYCGVFGREGA